MSWIREGIDVANIIDAAINCYYWFINYGCEFPTSVCNGCLDLTMLCLNHSDIAIITVKGVDCHCINGISKSEAIDW